MHRISQAVCSWLLVLGLTLGSFRGFLALFEDRNREPRQIYPCRVDSLPPADQQALAAGIPVRSEKELQHLLKDYLS